MVLICLFDCLTLTVRIVSRMSKSLLQYIKTLQEKNINYVLIVCHRHFHLEKNVLLTTRTSQ